MNRAQLIRYQAELWPAACAGQGWDVRDETLRRDVRRDCLEAIGVSASRADDIHCLDSAEITALFVFLDHLANPNHIGKLQTWTDCQADFRAFNVSRQADYWQRRGGFKGRGKLVRNRFARRDTAVPKPFQDDALDAKEAEDRLMTMRARTRRKEGRVGVPPATGAVPAPHQPDLIPPPPVNRVDAYASVRAAVGYTPMGDDEDMPF